MRTQGQDSYSRFLHAREIAEQHKREHAEKLKKLIEKWK
jgi:hypothetical protein